MCIIKTAAKLIKKQDASCESYPTSEQMTNSEMALTYVPKTLPEILHTELKRAPIGQAIMEGTRPRVILAPKTSYTQVYTMRISTIVHMVYM